MGEYTKAEVVDYVSTISEVSKADTAKVLDSFVDLVNAALEGGHVVGLPGLGKFECSATSARTGRNPHTGEEIAIPAGTRAKFKPATRLKVSAKT